MTPVSARTYTEAGLPWFDYYDADAADLPPSQELSDVKPVDDWLGDDPDLEGLQQPKLVLPVGPDNHGAPITDGNCYEPPGGALLREGVRLASAIPRVLGPVNRHAVRLRCGNRSASTRWPIVKPSRFSGQSTGELFSPRSRHQVGGPAGLEHDAPIKLRRVDRDGVDTAVRTHRDHEPRQAWVVADR